MSWASAETAGHIPRIRDTWGESFSYNNNYWRFTSDQMLRPEKRSPACRRPFIVQSVLTHIVTTGLRQVPNSRPFGYETDALTTLPRPHHHFPYPMIGGRVSNPLFSCRPIPPPQFRAKQIGLQLFWALHWTRKRISLTLKLRSRPQHFSSCLLFLKKR